MILLMGVAGSGKTRIGSMLAEALQAAFLDADTLHAPSNIERMRRGQALSDADRAPWLAACAGALEAWRRSARSGVLACSALKTAYRHKIAPAESDVMLVHLAISPALAERRLRARVGHFMPPSLVESQFADLEGPAASERALVVDASRPPEEIVCVIAEAVKARFGLSAAPRRASLKTPRPSLQGERP